MSVRRTRRTWPAGRRPAGKGLCRSGREPATDPGGLAVSAEPTDPSDPEAPAESAESGGAFGSGAGPMGRGESAFSPPTVSVEADDADARVRCLFVRAASDGNAVDHVPSRR